LPLIRDLVIDCIKERIEIAEKALIRIKNQKGTYTSHEYDMFTPKEIAEEALKEIYEIY
jgi:hypothetical protein